ncbi:YveK family protein [Paenibacillus campi]|uniref:YveK family protein n=1 Tax=Paenibacillus campi TaxID=3106031 RepID=UPI002AFDE830|nr:Wzz/FepE/Etk N-terminal domain-containing protein [Paenibacillus sp. SGZ-1014]
MEIKQYLNIVKKRLWLIMLIVVVITAATAAYAFMTNAPKYTATAKLVVNSTPKSTDGATGNQLDLGTINSNIQLIKTYQEIIKTPAIMNKVVQDHPELGLNATQLINMVSVSSVNETQVMSLTVTDGSYERAAKTVNAIAKVFQSEVPQIMNLDNIIVLDQADPSAGGVPIGNSPILFVLIALVLSVVIGIAVAFLLEYMDDSIKTEDDIRDVLGLPVLGVIAKMNEEDMTAKEPVPAKPLVGGGERANHT